MSKKVLILSSSPRKGGNSELLCEQFMSGAAESGHEVEKLFLREKKIGFCTACDYCRNHDGICTQKDDMAEILDKMMEADVLVLSTPVYFYSLNAHLKALIDRTYAKHTKISDKEVYYIMTAADQEKEAMDGTIHCLDGFTRCLPNAKVCGKIWGINAWDKGDIKENPAMAEAHKMGKSI